mmetsp:Transcript_62035/g.121827  ORF Transcript_62035/g.121827 Transcript_62035/m.121827 type:complete len:205 (-) Transcript_62035:631-1245(-)
MSMAPRTPTPWFARSLRMSTSAMISALAPPMIGFLPTLLPSLMRLASFEVMCVCRVVYGILRCSAKKCKLIRSSSGLFCSCSHSATASVISFKPSPFDQFLRVTTTFWVWGLAAAAGGAAAAVSAAGLSAAALRPAFDAVLVGRPRFVFGLKKDVILLKPCSLAAPSVFGSFFGGAILTLLSLFWRTIAKLMFVSICDLRSRKS